MPPFGFNSGLFTFPGFIVSLVGIKKKKKGRKRYKEKERKNEENKKEGMRGRI